MYARCVSLKLTPNGRAEFINKLETDVIPLLRKQKGFQDEITFLTSKHNEAVAISFWDSQENADAYNHVAYLDVLRTLSKVIEGMPIVETFEIIDSTSLKIASSAA